MNRNSFYNYKTPSSVQFVFNPEPNFIKTFKNDDYLKNETLEDYTGYPKKISEITNEEIKGASKLDDKI